MAESKEVESTSEKNKMVEIKTANNISGRELKWQRAEMGENKKGKSKSHGELKWYRTNLVESPCGQKLMW